MAVHAINPIIGTTYEEEYFSFFIFLLSDLLEVVTVTGIREKDTDNELIYRLGTTPMISGEFSSVFDQNKILMYGQETGTNNIYTEAKSFSAIPLGYDRIVKYEIDPTREKEVIFEVDYLEGATAGTISVSILVRNNFSKRAISLTNQIKKESNASSN